jgi:predicted RNase H-like nuclease
MKVILAIDAAWTLTEPSGVALIAVDDEEVSCLAATPSYDSFVALTDGVPVDWQQRRFPGSNPDIPVLLDAAQSLAGQSVNLVTGDIPVSTVPITGRREADDQISREFGGRWCSAHSPSAARPGELGAAFSNALYAAGYPLVTNAQNQLMENALIEVYPHPALLSLLNRPQRVPYKVSKSHRYWPQTPVAIRVGNLLNEFAAIYQALNNVFGPLPFQLPAAADVLSLGYLKRYEDALDALVCAWIGVQFLNGTTVALGDHTAAIWCPQNVVHSMNH